VIITAACLLLAIHLGTWGFSAVGGDAVRVIICLGLLGAVCGFLPFNRHPAKIFMGDAGSMLLGFVVAALMTLFVSDRGHIYDQMIDRGIPLKRTVAICYGLAGMYALVGLAMSQIRTRYALIVYIVVFVASGIVVWKKGYLKMGNW
jgi:UDP-N-acetylmuramyl pentapeptide phosphotransferase/UDP-N-acetylglucosamine-1-phosphate transferase